MAEIQLPQPQLPPTPEKKASPMATAKQSLPSSLIPLWGWTILTLLVVSVVGALYLEHRHTPSDDPNPPTRLIIVQLNDTYRLDAVRDRKRGGLARVATFLRQLKTQNPNVPVIVLHAGDFLMPSLESDPEFFRGQQMIEALNFLQAIAPLYAVPGNHEFDDKEPAILANAIERSQFHWVLSNLERGDTSLLPLLRDRADERLVLPFGKLKVGILALTLDAAHQSRNQTYAPINGDYAASAKREIEQLEQDGVVRERESDWGSFLADNMREAYGKPYADIAVINGGSIRIDDTFCDKVTLEHLERTFAYPSPVVFVKLTSKDVREQILEPSIESKKGDGRFLQVSGISFRRELGREDGRLFRT